MKLTERTIIILGAGFTKAFLPEAPLLVDDYDAENLLKKYDGFQHAKRILQNEVHRNQNGKIDIERLLTRLQGQMPYDREHNADPELTMLLSELKSIFSRRIIKAKEGQFYKDELSQFAKVCLEKSVSLITFNYDDILDQALWEVKKAEAVSQQPYWHPDGGYGFFCRPSKQLVVDTSVAMDLSNMLLLKLHGSVNWRIRKGYEPPLSLDAIVHHEKWLPNHPREVADPSLIDIHLETDPFIIPPLLTKETLIKQPILRLLWAIAYQKLAEADTVVFVGYSLPITDIASGFLFGETIQKETKIRVVNLGSTSKKQRELRARYRKLFPRLRGEHFLFKDAKEWCQEVVSKNP